jgi:glycosyltransferase involved in cell wall biosynthesis
MKSGRIAVLHAITNPTSTVLMRGQLAWLKANGFDSSLLCSPGSKLDRMATEENISIFPVAMTREISPFSDLRSFIRIVRLLRRIRPVICNAGTPKAGLLVGLAASLNRVPCRVYTLRGLRLETATGIKRAVLTVTEKISCLAAHRVICVSPSLRDRAIELNLVPAHKTVLLGAGSSNGVNTLRFAPTPEKRALALDLRARLGIKPDQPVIGFVGRLTRDKGIPELVMAFQSVRKILPETVLLLVGDYEAGDPIPANIREAIESDSAIHRVAFNPDVDRYYAVMDLFILPTHREGFPNTVLEAQASSLPVITTFATGAIDSIEDGVTGLLFPVGAVDKLVDALHSLLSDPARMQSMGRVGRERVLRHFRNEIVWEALASLYRTMLRERGYACPAPLTAPAPAAPMETQRCTQVQ